MNINEKFDALSNETKEKLNQNFDTFKKELYDGTKDVNHFITIDEIEDKLGEFINSNNKDGLDYISNILSAMKKKN